MKRISRLLFLAGAISLFTVTGSKAQEVVVRARMHAPVVSVRPERPSPHYVWIGEEWVPGGGTYVYRGDYWAAPPRPYLKWIPGYWLSTPRGWVWRQGHWR